MSTRNEAVVWTDKIKKNSCHIKSSLNVIALSKKNFTFHLCGDELTTINQNGNHSCNGSFFALKLQVI